MDPLLTPIIIILGKYALDKGVELGKEVGPQALAAATKMFQVVLERIAQKKPETAAEFPQEPETYQKPLEKALAAEIAADPNFAAQLKALLEEYEVASKSHQAATQTAYQAQAGEAAAIAQGTGATAATASATEGGQAAGIVHGNVSFGDRTPEA